MDSVTGHMEDLTLPLPQCSKPKLGNINLRRFAQSVGHPGKSYLYQKPNSHLCIFRTPAVSHTALKDRTKMDGTLQAELPLWLYLFITIHICMDESGNSEIIRHITYSVSFFFSKKCLYIYIWCDSMAYQCMLVPFKHWQGCHREA